MPAGSVPQDVPHGIKALLSKHFCKPFCNWPCSPGSSSTSRGHQMALRGAEGTPAALVERFDEVPPVRRPEDLRVAPQALSQLRVVRLAFLTRAVGTRYCTASLVGVFISAVLKVTYHGSNTPWFLNSFEPEIALI